MIAEPEQSQRIARLTPLADAFARIDHIVHPAAPHYVSVAAALGRTLARDVRASSPYPATAIALRDGWAVRSEETQDAGAYAPAILSANPRRLEAGDEVPAGFDAVAESDVVRERGVVFEALCGVAPGDGVLPAGADADPQEPVARAGRVIRRTDIAMLAALGVSVVEVRDPRIMISAARADVRLAADVAALADLARADGGAVEVTVTAEPEGALVPNDAELIVLVGGTGVGARDHSVQALARVGELAFHGVALSPGETAAFGTVARMPVLLLPGRRDAALAAWLTLGRRVLARLCGRGEIEPTASAVLSRKVASNLGLSELILLRREGDTVTPLASGYLGASALLQADGYLLVPPDSEGYPPGSRIDMRVLP